VTRFPIQLSKRAAATIAQTARLVNTAHQRLNSIGSQVSALTPGDWELLTLEAGWSNISGYIPAQVRIQQSGVALLVGHIQGGTVTNGTVIATLGSGYYNAVHAHSFTANVLAGASAVAVSLADASIGGTTDTDGVPDGTTSGSSGQINTGGAGAAHTHSSGSYALTDGQHSHSGSSGAGSLAVAGPTTPISYNTPVLTVNTSGELILTNCSSAATQLSFNEQLPLVTS
jgi:hypothetical protein